MEKASAIIVAAGKSSRFRSATKKQFWEIGGKPIVYHTIEKFEKCEAIGEIILVIPKNDLLPGQNDLGRNTFLKLAQIVVGGNERQDSVANGLAFVSPQYDLVAIHDGVRPFISQEKIKAVVNAAAISGAAILAVKPKDTIKEAINNTVKRTLERDRLILAQTPQVFRKALIQRAFQYAKENSIYGTDDATLVERIEADVLVVEGDYYNIKITSVEDLLFAKLLL